VALGPARRAPRVGLIGLPLAALAVLGAVGTADPMRAALLLAARQASPLLGVAPAWAVCLEIGGVQPACRERHDEHLRATCGGAASPVVRRHPLSSAGVLAGAARERGGAVCRVWRWCWLAIDPAQRIDTEEVRP